MRNRVSYYTYKEEQKARIYAQAEAYGLQCCGNCDHDTLNDSLQADCDLGIRYDNSADTGDKKRLYDGQFCERWEKKEAAERILKGVDDG